MADVQYFVCCFCGQDPIDSPDYVQLDARMMDPTLILDDARVREQRLGAHGACLRERIVVPGAFQLDID